MTDKWLSVLNSGNDRLICQSPERNYSMSQMRQRINALQSAILSNGKRKWVLYDENGFEFVCAMFALLISGRQILIPVSKHQTVIEPLLEPDVGLIGNNTHLPSLQDKLDIVVPEISSIENATLNVPIQSPHRLKEKWGEISFSTSGSSGQPKIITKCAEQLYLEAETFLTTWEPSSKTLFVPLVTHLHMYGLAFAFLFPMIARAGIYLTRSTGMLGVVEPITLNRDREIESLIVVTSPTIGRQAEQIKVLNERGSLACDNRPVSISRVYSAGGKLSNTNARKIAGLFDCPVTEIFGSTETGAVATREHSLSDQLDQEKSWRLLSGLEAGVIVDKTLVQSEGNITGEFAVWGGHVGGARDVPVLSGDDVRFSSLDRFQLIGRNSDICKIEGKRISLEFVVTAMESCSIIDEAVVLPYEKNGKEVLLCGVTLSMCGLKSYQSVGKSNTDKLIRDHLLKILDPVIVPRSIRYLDTFPRNEMGKLPIASIRKALVNTILPQIPLLESHKFENNMLVLNLKIPLELSYLKGHFENKPIVPGVVLLHWIYYYTDYFWKCLLNPAVVNRLKFSHPVSPGFELVLTIWRNENAIEFEYAGTNGNKFSSGQIPYLH